MTSNDDDDGIKWSNFEITQLCIKGSFGGNLFEPHTSDFVRKGSLHKKTVKLGNWSKQGGSAGGPGSQPLKTGFIKNTQNALTLRNIHLFHYVALQYNHFCEGNISLFENTFHGILSPNK